MILAVLNYFENWIENSKFPARHIIEQVGMPETFLQLAIVVYKSRLFHGIPSIS